MPPPPAICSINRIMPPPLLTHLYTKMKTALLVLSFLLIAFTSNRVVCAAKPEPVLDISGQKLRTGVNYYILPVIRGRSGGLTLSSKGNNTCPLYVVQEKFEVRNGNPVIFSPIDKKDIVYTSTDLNIKTSGVKTTCAQSTVWKLLKELTGVWFLSTGGVEGNPGFDTVTNWFKIEKAGKDYNLVFCPKVCRCQTLCRELGIYIDESGKRHLALSDKIPPFSVMFKRA
ncbi:Kunitz type trypsin inhibitor / miraculin [Quillaja saponaria]|uniref:Kunitz type trypsin inhibitor / miraculin n=1 Tax=Quillaja saponaria TaxID=32244 RepID=A0AAD7M554_QUISA|nr:Kunitz type trypsin inhibitor / miraculin [Quillaja saponaria]